MLFCCIVITFSFLHGCLNEKETLDTTIYVKLDGSGDYSSIQQAINNANSNNTIRIGAGVFYETLTVNKSIFLVGEDPTVSIIDGSVNGSVVSVNADSIHIEGLTFRNSGSENSFYNMEAGLDMKTNNSVINNCIFINNNVGLQIKHSKSNQILHNTFQNNSYGLYLYHSINNTISNNSAVENKDYGCYIWTGSDENTIVKNYFLENEYGLRVKSQHNTVTKNLFKDNEKGVYFCCAASNNIFYHNALINNSEYNGKTNFRGNTWYKESIQEGNYWSDYSGLDTDSNGIGDTSYRIGQRNSNGELLVIEDKYPLMNPLVEG